MSDERRYSDEEVEIILHRAVDRSVERRQDAGTSRKGLTLPQLEEIGEEVGVSAETVREAAVSLDRSQGIGREWGLPMSVHHTVPLARDLTDQEWARLLGDLRQTFGAKGRAESAGGMRGWTNSNLHAYVEPDTEGWRLRMGTTKGNARAFVRIGGSMLLATLVLSVMVLLDLNNDPSGLLGIMGTLGPMGLAFLGAGAIQLPSWSHKRQEQMEQIEHRLLARMAAPTRGEESAG